MKSIRTEIEIAASAAQVWQVLTDFASYPSWNPSMIEVRTDSKPGARVDMVFQSSSRKFVLDARILRFDAGQELCWQGPLSRVVGLFFGGTHYWKIEEAADGKHCRLVHGEEFFGGLIPFMGGWLDREIVPAYQAFNQALKSRVESAT
ncbi:MAG: hypothetical protein ACI8TX_003493 [Hyphomicrobiaceae bacterium]|jgi:hypothetical protein